MCAIERSTSMCICGSWAYSWAYILEAGFTEVHKMCSVIEFSWPLHHSVDVSPESRPEFSKREIRRDRDNFTCGSLLTTGRD